MGKSVSLCYAALAFALSATGCAITSGFHSGPNGRPVHYIDGMTAGVAYKKAAQLCPSGYEILGDPRQTTALDYEMTVECKAPSFAGSTPTASPAHLEQVAPVRQQGTPLQRASQISSAMGCSAPSISTNSSGRSVYRATCPAGELVIDCSGVTCQVLSQPPS